MSYVKGCSSGYTNNLRFIYFDGVNNWQLKRYLQIKGISFDVIFVDDKVRQEFEQTLQECDLKYPINIVYVEEADDDTEYMINVFYFMPSNELFAAMSRQYVYAPSIGSSENRLVVEPQTNNWCFLL